MTDRSIEKAADALFSAKHLLVAAGAGMGVDSGLPDFRGDEGFWNAYPVYKDMGLRFDQMADPKWFLRDPRMAWGFYGHRLELYRDTTPHEGFQILRRIGAGKTNFVFTSNVDGAFQKAGWPEGEVHECHGSVHHLQCLEPMACREEIWSADDYTPAIDLDEFVATGPLPTCHNCGGLARPNIMMFGDYGWLSERTSKQYLQYHDWIRSIDPRDLTIVEIGAGTAIPSVRLETEDLSDCGATLIRINPREAHDGDICLPMSGLEALHRLEKELLRE